MKVDPLKYFVVFVFEVILILGIPILTTVSITCNWPSILKIIFVVIFGMEIVCLVKYGWDSRKEL